MKNKRNVRLGALLLTLTILFSAIASAADVEFRQDTEKNYLKYITGFSDNTVRPDAVLTRAQGAQMLYYVLELDAEKAPQAFQDVSENYWGYRAIAALSANGVLNGYGGNRFLPENGLTRAEFSAILCRAMALDTAGKTSQAFCDVSGHWAEGSIAALFERGYINGYADGTFRPDKALTRAEAVKLINQATKIQTDIDDPELRFSDLPTTHWAYAEIMAATSSTALETNIERGNIKFSEIQYIEMDSAKLREKAQQLFVEFDTANAQRQAELYREVSKMLIDMGTAISMATINAQRDTSNAQYKADYAKIPEISNLMQEISLTQYQKLTDSKYRDQVCELLGISYQELQRPLDPMPQSLVDLFTKQSEYVNEFNEFYYTASIAYQGQSYSVSQAMSSADAALYRMALDFYVAHEDTLNTIFDNLVKVRTEIAQYFNCSNYFEAAYSYYEDDILAFRSDVKQYIVPLYQEITKARNGKSSAYSFPNTDFLKGTDDVTQQIIEALRDMSPQTRQAIDYMVKYEMFDLLPRENKGTGAFTLYLEEFKSTFLFMNAAGGYSDVSTFPHEFGHSLQNFRLYAREPNISFGMDIAETASTAMECLMTNRYEDFFGEYALDAENYLLYQYLWIIMSTNLLDEFQIEIYKNPDMTPTERNQLYRKLDEEYFGEYPDNAHEAFQKGLVWSNPGHIFESPFYAIDYALATATALQIWEIAKTNFDQAFETYMGFIESKYLRFGIETTCKIAGLQSPFSKGTMESVASMIGKRFQKSAASANAA